MRKNRLAGIFLLLLSGGALGLLQMLDPTRLESDPGPLFLPRVVSIGLLICGLGIVVSANKEIVSKTLLNRRSSVLTISLVLYGILLQLLGFLPSTFGFVLFAVWWLGSARRQDIWLAVAAAVVVTSAVYYLFGVLLNIVLPRGLFY